LVHVAVTVIAPFLMTAIEHRHLLQRLRTSLRQHQTI
jgi:hypothetical protein